MHTLTLLGLMPVISPQGGQSRWALQSHAAAFPQNSRKLKQIEQSCISRSADIYQDSHVSPSGSIHWSWDKSVTIYTFAREGWKLGKTPHLEEGLQGSIK